MRERDREREGGGGGGREGRRREREREREREKREKERVSDGIHKSELTDYANRNNCITDCGWSNKDGQINQHKIKESIWIRTKV